MKSANLLLWGTAVLVLSTGCPSPASAPGAGAGSPGAQSGPVPGTWDPLGPSFPSASASVQNFRLRVGNDGVPVAAYVDGTDPLKPRLSVARWSGSAWQVLGGTPVVNSNVEYISLALGADGQPLVTYRDITALPLGGVIGFRKFNGSSWEEGWSDPIAEGLVITSSLIVLPNGHRVAAYDDQGHPNAMSVVDMGSSLTDLGARGAVSGRDPHLAAVDNQLYLASLSNANKVQVHRYDGLSGWTAIGSPIDTAGNLMAFAADKDGNLYLALDLQNTSAPPSVLKWSGTAWQELGGGPVPGPRATSLDLAVTASGPVLAYAGVILFPVASIKRTVLRYQNGWFAVGSSFGETSDGRQVQLAVGPGETLYMGAIEVKPAVVRKLN